MEEGGDLLAKAVEDGRTDLLLSLAQTSDARLRQSESWGQSPAAARWLGVIVKGLQHPEAQRMAGIPYWGEQLRPLALAVAQHAESLSRQGADPEAALLALMPFVQGND
jgi:hypothetical protein